MFEQALNKCIYVFLKMQVLAVQRNVGRRKILAVTLLLDMSYRSS